MVDTLDGRKIGLREVLSEPLRLFRVALATLERGRGRNESVANISGVGRGVLSRYPKGAYNANRVSPFIDV